MYVHIYLCVHKINFQRTRTHTEEADNTGEEKTKKLENGVHMFNIETDVYRYKTKCKQVKGTKIGWIS